MTVAHDHGDTTQEKNGVPDAHATLEKSSVAPGPLGPTGPDDPTGPRLNVEVGSSSGSWFGGTGFNAGHGSSGKNVALPTRKPVTFFNKYILGCVLCSVLMRSVCSDFAQWC